MSLFRTYTPKFLFHETLSLINVLFHAPPRIDTVAAHSYFQATLNIHKQIRTDLNDILTEDAAPTSDTTIDQVHASLQQLEKQLFGTESTFEVDIKGCCLYTRSLEARLSTMGGCSIV
jgi:hypothetical protein